MGLEQGTRARTARNTAEAFASLRAAGSSVRDEHVRNPDHLASRFIPLLSEELELGIEQLVILGAGFDTRAYRFADRLAAVRVFELDHPVTAALKQARVRRVFGALPHHVTYICSDLEREDLGDALRAAGYEPATRTLFIWSGVSFYLSAEAVGSVLAFVRRCSGPGSSIMFDYHYQGFTDGTREYYGSKPVLDSQRRHRRRSTVRLHQHRARPRSCRRFQHQACGLRPSRECVPTDRAANNAGAA